MANLQSKPQVTTTIILELSEIEARALYAINRYGTDVFIKSFKDHIGAILDEGRNEEGLRSLLESANELLPPIFRQLDEAKKVFSGTKSK